MFIAALFTTAKIQKQPKCPINRTMNKEDVIYICIWIVSSASLSNSSLFVYINTTDFSILILYPATLLSLILLIVGVLVESLGFYVFF